MARVAVPWLPEASKRSAWCVVTAGCSGPDDELLVGVAGIGEGVPVQDEPARRRVDEDPGAGGEAGNVASGPPLAELRVLHRQLGGKPCQTRIIGVLRRLHPQLGDGRFATDSQSLSRVRIAGSANKIRT